MQDIVMNIVWILGAVLLIYLIVTVIICIVETIQEFFVEQQKMKFIDELGKEIEKTTKK